MSRVQLKAARRAEPVVWMAEEQRSPDEEEKVQPSAPAGSAGSQQPSCYCMQMMSLVAASGCSAAAQAARCCSPLLGPGLVSVGGGFTLEETGAFPPPAAATTAFQVGRVKGAAARSGLAFRGNASDEP